jgi:hypothetical protein
MMNKKVRITIRDWENVGYCFLLLFGGIMMLYNSFAVGDKLGTIFFGGLSFLFLFFGFVFLYIENENKYIIEVSGRVVKHG